MLWLRVCSGVLTLMVPAALRELMQVSVELVWCNSELRRSTIICLGGSFILLIIRLTVRLMRLVASGNLARTRRSSLVLLVMWV